MAGIIKIRRLTQVMLAPVVVILVASLCITAFIGLPRYGRDDSFILYKGPAAEVNGKKIKDEDFNAVYLRYLQTYGNYSEEATKNDVLDYVINQELIAQAVEEQGVEPSREEIDSFLARLRQYYPTEEEMEMLFLRTGVKDMKELEKLVAEDLRQQNLFVRVAGEKGVEIPEERVKEIYEVMTISHILIATSPEMTEKPLSDSAALAKAESIYKRIMEGEDFGELAKENSDCRESAQAGGSLGRNTIVYFRNKYDQDFIKTALQLEVGEVSTPVKTEYGYHLIRLDDMRLAEGEEWEKEKERIRKELLVQEFVYSDKFAAWLEELRDAAKIVILDPALRAYRLRLEEKWPEAALAYEKAIKDKRYRDNFQIYLSAARVYKEMQDYAGAMNVLERVPKKHQEKLEYTLEKARIYHADGKVKEAEGQLTAAEEKAGENTYDLNQILFVARELELTEKVEQLEEKIALIEEKRRAEQEETERLIREEPTEAESAEPETAETESGTE